MKRTREEIEIMENKTFAEIVANVSDDVTKETAATLAREIDARAEYENKKNADNLKIQDTLKGVRAGFTKGSVARFCVASNTPLNFINRSERAGNFFNVYAAQKLLNVAEALTIEKKWNDINRCILASMVKLEKAGIEFTHKLAIAACSKSITCDAGVSKHLVRHTVAPSTASTQASSTMQALKTAGVVVEYKNDAGADCYRFTENPIVAAIRDKVK